MRNCPFLRKRTALLCEPASKVHLRVKMHNNYKEGHFFERESHEKMTNFKNFCTKPSKLEFLFVKMNSFKEKKVSTWAPTSSAIVGLINFAKSRNLSELKRRDCLSRSLRKDDHIFVTSRETSLTQLVVPWKQNVDLTVVVVVMADAKKALSVTLNSHAKQPRVHGLNFANVSISQPINNAEFSVERLGQVVSAEIAEDRIGMTFPVKLLWKENMNVSIFVHRH